MNQSLTGYPSIDKPWMKYYPKDASIEKADKDTVYNFVVKRNQDNLDGIALDYFGAKTTYKQLFEKIDVAAKSFSALGVKSSDIVSLVVLSSPQAFISIYALNKIGAVANVIEPRTNASSIVDRINATNSEVLLVVGNIYDRIKGEMRRCCAKNVIVYSLADSMHLGMKLAYYTKYGFSKVPYSQNLISWKSFIALAAHAEDVHAVPFVEKTPATIVYTGGTTGMAKGALLPNEAFTLMHYCKEHSAPPFERGETFLGIMPPFIAYGMMFGFFMALSFGCKIAIVPVFDPDKFDALILKHRPAHIFGVPSFFERLTTSKLMEKADLSCIRGIITGGDYMPEQTEKKINAFLQAHNCKAKVYKGYGMTELSSAAVYTAYDECNVPGTIGIPLVLNNVKIIHPESGEELKYEEQGEICISSPTQMLGYYNNPFETAKIMQIHWNYFLPVIVTLAIFVFTLLIALVATLMDNRSKIKRDTKKDELYYALNSKRLIWLISSMLWRMAYYICVLISFISSVTIVYISSEASMPSRDILIFSIITTALVLFEFVIKPKENSVVYRLAFFEADAALNKYTYSNDPSGIADALIKGEEIINKSYSD